MFDSKAIELLGYYVYALFDPRNPSIPFYIGKGHGNRVFTHATGVSLSEGMSEEPLSPKMELIANILNSGCSVIHKVIRYGLAEEDALNLEASLIDLVNHMYPETLKNQVSGHGSAEGIIDAVDLATSLKAEPLNTEESILIIKIERLWGELLSQYGSANSIPKDKIYKAVRGNWKVSMLRAKRATYICAVARGIVRAVYVSDNWFLSDEEGRKCFDGKEVVDQQINFTGKSVVHLFKRGGQNPIRYLNC